MQLETIALWLLVVFVIANANGNENTTLKQWGTLSVQDFQTTYKKDVESRKYYSSNKIYENPRRPGSEPQHHESYNLVARDSNSHHDRAISSSKIRDSPSPRPVNTELLTITESVSSTPSVTNNIRPASMLTDVNSETYRWNLPEVKIYQNGDLNQTFAENPFNQSRKDNTGCHHIQGSRNNICPEGFKLLISGSNFYCVIIIGNQKFPPTCPYPNFLPYTHVQFFADKYFRHDSVWIQAFRNISSGFPDFQWIGYHSNYFHDSWNLSDNIAHSSSKEYKNCVVRKNATIYPVSCAEEHTAICIYSFDNLIKMVGKIVCREELSQSDFCISAHYDLREPTCFCKMSNKFQPPKNSFCEKLAEPILPYQTQLLVTAYNLPATKCWIGLKKEVDTYKWSSTNEKVSYTEWAKPSNCKFSEGALKFGKYGFAGWALQKDRTLDCAICEIKKTPEIPRLGLYRHYENHYSLVLYLEHQHGITSFYDYNDIHCFSDENEYGFKTHVKNYDIQADHRIYSVAVSRNLPSHYWCEAFQVSSFDVVKSDVVVTHWMFDYVHEFSIHIKVNVSLEIDSIINQANLICEQMKERINGSYDVESVRPMRVYFDENAFYANMIVHVSIAKTKRSPTEAHLTNLLSNMSIIVDILSSRVCPLTSTNTSTGLVLEWPETPIGATAIPSNRLCLDEEHDMLPVTRKCEGDFLNGGKWGKPLGSCFENTTYSETSTELFSFLNQNISAETLIDDLLRITGAYTKKQSIDIHLIAQNLEKLDFISEQINVINYSIIVSNIMYFDKKTLRQAQLLLNSTDKILSSLDNLLNNENYSTIVSPRLITQIIDLNDTNVTGTALYKETPDADSFKEYKFSLLFKNTSVETIITNEQLQMAVILPEERINKGNTSKLVVTVFYNDRLFHEEESHHDLAKIISVSTPGIIGRLRNPIRIYFKTPEGRRFKVKECTSWDYGISPLSVSIPGHWKIDGVSKTEHGLVELCEFYHMTHFGNLLKIEVEHHELPLEIITVIGSALSLIGIIPIYATAIFFKKWRKRPGNIILLNFCTAITLQIVLTFLLYAIENDGIFCKIIGALMHYSILSEFCWMLLIAILQYKRYVVVLKPRKANILKKSLFVGWGTPLFPILVSLCISPTIYKFSEVNKFCYLTGYYFYFGLIFPIVLILSINGIIFGIIIYNISQSNVTICVERSRDYKREILLAFLLFFILGLSWFFGLLGILGVGDWVTYMFCLTATLRGLILFMYFIFGNEETRLLWKTRLTYLRYKIMLLKMRRSM